MIKLALNWCLNSWYQKHQVNDELRQSGNTGDMVHSIPFLISHVSKIMTLEEGDVIITGTPEGVGPVPSNSVRPAYARVCVCTYLSLNVFSL